MGSICKCGCGLPAPVASRSDTRKGWKKGQPLSFRQGHGRRKPFNTQYHIEDAGFTTPCWTWIGARRGPASLPYGVYCRFDGSRVGAHIFAVEQDGREIPVGMQVDHLCRNSLCVNPDHLEVVTPTENVRRSRRAKLTMAQALEIRESQLGCRRLAREFGVAASTIKRIRRGVTWVA